MTRLLVILAFLAILCGSAFAQQMSGCSLSGAVIGWTELLFCVDADENYYVDDEGNNYVL